MKRRCKRYPERLTDKDILQLFKEGAYQVDPKTGTVYGKNGRPLPTFSTGRDPTVKYAFIRLYTTSRGKRKRRGITVARLVWMWVTRRVVPRGFEIHHDDGNIKNNSWENLYCLYERDHRKLHGKSLSMSDEEIPY